MQFLLGMVFLLGGWLTGGLINYLADVLPRRRRLASPFCTVCDHNRSWQVYLLWPRSCAACRAPAAWRAWAVQLLSAGALVALWFWPPQRLNYPAWVVLWVYFMVVAVIDLEHHLILHPVSLAGGLIGAALGLWAHGWVSTLLGGLAGLGAMFALYWFGRWVVRWLARRRGQTLDIEAGEDEGLGFGDVLLGGVLGLILGWPGIAAGLMLAFLLGGAVSLVYLLLMLAARRYEAFQAIPYGPFLLAGAAILLLVPAPA